MGTSGRTRRKISRVAAVTALLFAIGTVAPSIVAANPVTTTSSCTASSRTWVNSALPQVVAGTFRLEFDATPASTGIDGVTGLSSGPAGAYTSLAAIVRFNPTGTIDAMNGTAYAAVAPIRYSAGTSYHFILDVNLSAHTYNASVVVNGAPATIGTNLAFRSQQAKVSSLNNLAAVAAVGSQTICNVTLTLTSSGCMTSSGTWTNSALPQVETGMFRLEFDATPASTGIDGVVGLSSGPAGAYTSLAAIVRFNSAGTIDARNGAAYTAAAAIRYSAGTSYHFILDVNLTAHTYNASVVVNGAQATIGTNLAFRSEQAGASSLSNLAAVATLGTQTICNVKVSAASVAPSVTTQPLSQTVNAGQTATFSVVGTGTAPMSYQWRKNGAAISGATASAYQTPATTTSDNGSLFSVVMSNSAGSVTSGGATLTVKSPAVAPSITAQPLSQTVTAGQTATFSVAGTGTAPLSYQWRKNGAAISGATSSTYQTPAATASDNGSQFTVVLSNSAGSVTSSSGTLTVSTGTLLLGANPTQLSFGSVNVSSNNVQNVMVTNTGTSNVTISSVLVSGAGFNAGGGIAGLILPPGQGAPLSVTFAPAAAGSVSGSVTVKSNATNSPITIALTGTGVAQTHLVDLSWTPSTSSVVGYNVYSSRVSGGPYVKLNSSPTGATSYADSTVQSGQTYYYVTTAVSSTGGESGFSTEVSAAIP